MLKIQLGGTRIKIHKNSMFRLTHIHFHPLDQRDVVSWVAMDHRQNKSGLEISKEQYLSYITLEVVISLCTIIGL